MGVRRGCESQIRLKRIPHSAAEILGAYSRRRGEEYRERINYTFKVTWIGLTFSLLFFLNHTYGKRQMRTFALSTFSFYSVWVGNRSRVDANKCQSVGS